MLRKFIPGVLHRHRARLASQRSAGDWPVHEATGRMPDAWPGWPDGKGFAFLLSHDVLGPRGLSRCRQLAELEMEYGFRSAFYFVPDGDYEVPRDLLGWLHGHGFEVGVLNRGRGRSPFASRKSGARVVAAVNRQLADWQAVGFRAGFQPVELDRLHTLTIEYDASFYDVDAFASRAQAVATIFPFWIPAPEPDADVYPGNARDAANRRGFVEMPHTLPPDHSLFRSLRDQSTQLWERKLDWIVRHGGMAFLNTQPDYMDFGGRQPEATGYPVARYADFLRWVRRHHATGLYHELPRVVARLARTHQIRQSRPPRQVCMLSFSAYEFDNRVRRYAESLARRGDHVTVLAIAATNQPTGEGELNGVRVLRLFKPSREERGKLDYVANYLRFGWRAFRTLRRRYRVSGCDLVHVHNMPEALVFAAVTLKWNGARVILDLHDLMPELYQDKFKLSSRHPACSLLRIIEGWACRFSDHVIISNHLWKRVVAARSRPDGQLTALINHVDLQLFHRRERTRTDGRFILLYPGSLSHHQGLDIAIAAMVQIHRAVPAAELHIYGRGSERVTLQQQAVALGLQEAVRFFSDVPFAEIGSVMADADLGLVPKRAEGFGNEAFSTKILEFMSQGLPVVVSRTKVDAYYFNDHNVCFFESANAADLADKVIALARSRARRESLVRNADRLLDRTSWQAVQSTYLDLVDRLTRTTKPGLQPAPARPAVDAAPAALPTVNSKCNQA